MPSQSIRTGPVPKPAHERVLARIERTADGCWIYQGALDKNGYGVVRLRVDGKRVIRQAHKIVFEALVGAVPDDCDVHHTCRHRSCANPAHLRSLARSQHRREHSGERCRKCGSDDWGGWTTPSGSFKRRCNECNRRNQRRLRSR